MGVPLLVHLVYSGMSKEFQRHSLDLTSETFYAFAVRFFRWVGVSGGRVPLVWYIWYKERGMLDEEERKELIKEMLRSACQSKSCAMEGWEWLFLVLASHGGKSLFRAI